MSYTRTLKTADGTGYVLTLPGAGLSRVAIGAESGECWVLPYINQTSAPSTPTSALITSVAGVASSKESIRLTASKSVVLDLSAGFSGDNTSLRYTHLAVWSVTAGIFEGSSGDLVYAVNTSVTPADGSVTTAKLAAAAVTGPKLATGAVKLLCATGRNGAGSMTLTGATSTDVLCSVTNLTDGGDVTSEFGALGTGTLTQSGSTDFSAKKLLVQLRPAS